MNPELQAAIDELNNNPELHARNRFAHDIVAKYHRFGSLSASQITALTESLQRDREDAGPKGIAPEGRQTVTGQVLSIKEKMNKFTNRSELKMLVKLANNSKVYATALPGVIKGDTITFTATFKHSKDDRSFAFGERPTLGGDVSAPRSDEGLMVPLEELMAAPQPKPKRAPSVPDGPSILEGLLAELDA